MFKCHDCKLILKESDLINGCCPNCKQYPFEMCERDTGTCDHGVVPGIKVCELCGEFICPICGAHDVSPISRVTGYYSPVEAWAAGKQQELKDRNRYEV